MKWKNRNVHWFGDAIFSRHCATIKTGQRDQCQGLEWGRFSNRRHRAGSGSQLMAAMLATEVQMLEADA